MRTPSTIAPFPPPAPVVSTFHPHGRPVGSIRAARRFTLAECILAGRGETLPCENVELPRVLSQQEAYELLFGGAS